MKQFEVFSFSEEAALASTAARRWLDRIVTSPQSAPLCVALSGGRITRHFFSSIVQECRRRECGLDRIQFFWSDERCVPPTDRESNFRVAQEFLFEPLSIPMEQIHRLRGELPPEEAIFDAEADVRRLCATGGNSQPIFDIVFLGMGEDGHIASLFPEEPVETIDAKGIYRWVRATKPPPNRLTLNYATIASAHQVWVLASGKGKEAALKDSLSANGTSPLARLLELRAKTTIFTDISIG